MKNKKPILILTITLILLITVFSVIYCIFNDKTQNGSKEIDVTIVFADKTEKEYTIDTDAEYLADALLEEKIIDKKSTDGMYTVIAGERADYTLDKSWWCLTKGGEMVNVGINDQPIADGDSFEITNTPS